LNRYGITYSSEEPFPFLDASDLYPSPTITSLIYNVSPFGTFIVKAFINVHADATGEKVEKMAADDIVSTYSKMPGNKAVKVGYITDSGMQYNDVYLTVANKHYMLFFKKYKVSAENLVVKDVTIKVPKGLAAITATPAATIAIIPLGNLAGLLLAGC